MSLGAHAGAEPAESVEIGAMRRPMRPEVHGRRGSKAGSSVRIKAIEPMAVSLPMKKPVTMAGETVARADNVLVRVESDDGFVGWGEAASAPTMTGETTASMMAAVAHMAPALLRRVRPTTSPARRRRWMRAMYGNSGAKAAIEIALHDLVGRAAGRPLYALFGGKARSRMAVLAVIGSTDAAADLREAQERWAAGYRAFKIKVGLGRARGGRRAHAAVCRMLKSAAARLSRLGRRQSGL